MNHAEICHLLDTGLRIAWWVVFPAMLLAIVFYLIALTRIGK